MNVVTGIPDRVAQPELKLELSIVLAVVSGRDCVRENLRVLVPQVNFNEAEIIVPFDKWSMEVGDLSNEFPQVRFPFIEHVHLEAAGKISAFQHRLFDRRRAAGLKLARGRIIAMTEDHALPAVDWVRQIIKCHELPFDAIGGAISNGVDKPLNRALYYCDFGRFGTPFRNGPVSYISDVNLAYKRSALLGTRKVWECAYQETAVNWELLKQGATLYLDDRPMVFQRRPPISLRDALRERVEWGRIFAETRCKDLTMPRRFIFATGTFLLPLILFVRAFGHILRQRLSPAKALSTLPLVLLLVSAWSLGEMLGYLSGIPDLSNIECKRTVEATEAP